MSACVRAYVRACVRACVCVCVADLEGSIINFEPVVVRTMFDEPLQSSFNFTPTHLQIAVLQIFAFLKASPDNEWQICWLSWQF